MNRFDLDHPMYVHAIAEPPGHGVPAPDVLRRTFPASADLASEAGREILRAEKYREWSWSVSAETLGAIRDASSNFKLFIEIGTFIGQGVLATSEFFAANGISCPIVTVDTYAGTLLIGVNMTVPHGYFRYFDHAVVASLFESRGLGQVTHPVHATARDFFRKFYYLGMLASHIYLDASHEYLDTYEEMRLAWECLEEGGVLAGDDYNWITVKAAVDRFCQERRLAYTIHTGRTNEGVTALQWVIAAKNSSARFDDQFHVTKAVP